MNYLELKHVAEDHMFNKRWSEAETTYLLLIDHPKYFRQLATQNSFRQNIAKCRIRMSDYSRAGDMFLEMREQILLYDNDSLKLNISTLLSKAYLCFRHVGNQDKLAFITSCKYWSVERMNNIKEDTIDSMLEKC